MVSRKDNNSSESSRKKINSHDDSSEDEQRQINPREQVSANSDHERRKSRVALRTGSPKPPSKFTLRPVRTQTPPPVVKSPSRGSRSPTRINLPSKSSVRIKPTSSSPERKPWGAPVIRVPPYHEENISKRKKIIVAKSASEETPPTQRKVPTTRRYSLASLLDLRPPPIRRYAALSGGSSEDSGISMGNTDQCSASTHTFIHPSSVQHQFHKNVLSSGEQPSTYYRGSYLANTATHGVPTIATRYDASSMAKKAEMYQGPFLTPKDSSQRIGAPAQSPTKELRQDIDDLEDRIRSALSHRRRHFEAPRSLRSVRWDPAVLAAGPQTPRHPLTNDTPNNVQDTPKFSGKPPIEEKPTHRETPEAEVSEHTLTTSTPENNATVRKRQKKEFYQHMKSITQLKKGDRKKLLQLLEALRNLDSDDSSDTDSDALGLRRKSRKAERSASTSSLNPTAPTFQDLPPIHHNVPIKPALRARVVPNENHDIKEPVWVKRSEGEGRELAFRRHNKEYSGPSQHDIFQTSPSRKTGASRKSSSYDDFDTRDSQQAPYFIPPTQLVPYTVPANLDPLKVVHGAPPIPAARTPRENTRVNPRLPIINLATGRIPDDDGPGREAHVVPWGNFILESFQQKYPRTGIQIADPPAPIKNTHAATIQQRLEYLLMEQKEKQARGEGLVERSGNHQNSKQVKAFYQAEKEIMKRLKAEIRRDEIERKLREPKPSTASLKIRIVVPTIERISESSTCVDSIELDSPERMDGEEAEGKDDGLAH